MPEVLVRNLDFELVERLKARAYNNGRSLQAEVKAILEKSVKEVGMEEFRRAALRTQKRLALRHNSDSAALIRKDRER